MNREYSVNIDGEQVKFEFKDCLMHCEGDAAGNIDAIITTKPPLPQNTLLDELNIKVPGKDEYLYIYSYGAVEDSLKATFNSSEHVDIAKPPEIVEVYWGEDGAQLIGEMSCVAFSPEAEKEIEDADEPVEEAATVSDEAKVDIKEDPVENVAKPEKAFMSSRNLIIGASIVVILCVIVFLI